jgi:hypothetical protein
MPEQSERAKVDFEYQFKLFHELMAKKVREILLVSTAYDAWMLEEDYSLSERIIDEYRGLNLSHPPRLNWAARAEDVLSKLDQKHFDMVIIMPGLADMDVAGLASLVKERRPDVPVILLSHGSLPAQASQSANIDRTFVWGGNPDILLAVIKNAEDRMNVDRDTEVAGIRVIIFVEDSPFYLSSLLPILYKELVSQTQEVMQEGLNEEHRLLTMRARPKILVAENFESGLELFSRYEPYVLGIISDVRYHRRGEFDEEAGVRLLQEVKGQRFDIPLLLISSDPSNARKARRVAADFLDKNSPSLHEELRSFLTQRLGFGDFVFRMPDGREIARAGSLLALERNLASIPDESFVHHCNRNDISRWLFARTETVLASKVRPLREDDFEDVAAHRRHLIEAIRARRKMRQRGIVVQFDSEEFAPDTDFLKIGKGSLGGKARGLAFLSSLLWSNEWLQAKYPGVILRVPQTLVLTTEGFDDFVEENDLKGLATDDLSDQEIAEHFLAAPLPEWIRSKLRAFVSAIDYPLAIRSSSLLEDAQFRAYAGLYKTYMLPNVCDDLETRLNQLERAVKLVFASTYYQAPRAFSERVGQRTEEEKMAVMVQELVGQQHGEDFYPTCSGVVQSVNYYPFSRMRPEDGIAAIALGLGKMVMEGGQAVRFSPRHPQLFPQQAGVREQLEQAQRAFYALELTDACRLDAAGEENLVRRDVFTAAKEPSVRQVFSTYVPQENRLRDSVRSTGYPVVTFHRILKHREFPLASLLDDVTALGQEGMGCPVELEFSVNLAARQDEPDEFALLQLRPMTARADSLQVDISQAERAQAFCRSERALGNVERSDIADIIYIKPRDFDPSKTREIASEVGQLNRELLQAGRKYLLIGPGRWGSADHWLGIPVAWSDISGVGAMVETTYASLQAEPSQGSHFFHNIISLGINYVTVTDRDGGFIDWDWLEAQQLKENKRYTALTRLDAPLVIKVDGRRSECVMYPGSAFGQGQGPGNGSGAVDPG